ncbi:MAG: co-chaperone GroES [Bdellovibrio sp.]
MAKAKKTAPKKVAKKVAQKSNKVKATVKAKIKAKVKTKATPKKSAAKPTAKPAAKKAINKAAKTPAKAAAKVSKTPTLKMITGKSISPLDDRVVLVPIEAPKMTAGGLHIPDSAELSGNLKAKVLAVGRGHLDKKGKIHPIELQVGDEVLFAAHAGSKITWAGQDLIVVRESDILGIVET